MTLKRVMLLITEVHTTVAKLTVERDTEARSTVAATKAATEARNMVVAAKAAKAATEARNTAAVVMEAMVVKLPLNWISPTLLIKSGTTEARSTVVTADTVDMVDTVDTADTEVKPLSMISGDMNTTVPIMEVITEVTVDTEATAVTVDTEVKPLLEMMLKAVDTAEDMDTAVTEATVDMEAMVVKLPMISQTSGLT